MSVMLANTYADKKDPCGWLMSEKLDGVRAYWTGIKFLTRTGRLIKAPQWFCAGLPNIALDGELWCGRGQFELSAGIAVGGAHKKFWTQIRFHVFDAPNAQGGFKDRLAAASHAVANAAYAVLHPHIVCQGRDHLRAELDRVESLDGEGLILRDPNSPYVRKRSNMMLKVKTFQDSEAVVISTEPTCMLVEIPGTCTRFGLGLAGRPCPKVGATVTFKFQGYTSTGIPRFASYLREAVPS